MAVVVSSLPAGTALSRYLMIKGLGGVGNIDPDAKLWFFFAEHFSEPRFGLDDTTEAPGVPTSWNAAAWQHVPADATFLTPTSFGVSLPKGDGKPAPFAWASSAAAQAWITLQFPFRRGIPASRLLPPEPPP